MCLGLEQCKLIILRLWGVLRTRAMQANNSGARGMLRTRAMQANNSGAMGCVSD